MSYPKPLSEKGIERLKQQSDLPQEKIDFIYHLLESSTYLCGVLHLDRLWAMYKQLATKQAVPKIMKKDLVTVTNIARRDDSVPYRVYEIDELYESELRDPNHRALIIKDILLYQTGAPQYYLYYDLYEKNSKQPLFVPNDLLDIHQKIDSPYKKDLLIYLGKLKVNKKTTTDRFKLKTVPCEHYGKNLRNFKWLSSSELFNLDYANGKYSKKGTVNQKWKEQIEAGAYNNAAEKLVEDFLFEANLGKNGNIMLGKLFDHLNDIGVQLTEKQREKIVDLALKLHKHSHLWCLCGWSPVLLMQATSRNQRPTGLQLGPEIRKQIERGEID